MLLSPLSVYQFPGTRKCSLPTTPFLRHVLTPFCRWKHSLASAMPPSRMLSEYPVFGSHRLLNSSVLLIFPVRPKLKNRITIVEHEHLRLARRMFLLNFYLLNVSFRGPNCLFKIISNINFHYFSHHFSQL